MAGTGAPGAARVGRGVGPAGPAAGRAPGAAPGRAHGPRQHGPLRPARPRCTTRRPRWSWWTRSRPSPTPRLTGAPGSLGQVRACTDLVVPPGQAHRVPFVLVGHVTKEGTLAGPRTLEHLVDTVLGVEGDRHHALRTVRATKHRFGPTGELGLFEMNDTGLAAVTDPYQLLLGDRRPGAPGSAVLPAMQGQRALLVEVQALTARTAPETPEPALGPGGGRRSPGAAAGRARAAGRGVAGAHRRLRLGRGWHPGARARRRPGPGPGAGLGGHRPAPARRPGGVRRGGPGGRDQAGAPRPAPAGRGGARRVPPCARARVVSRRAAGDGGRARAGRWPRPWRWRRGRSP